MAHMVVDASDIESPNGVFRGLSAPLGVGKFKVNRLELAPGAEGPDHDELLAAALALADPVGGHYVGVELDFTPEQPLPRGVSFIACAAQSLPAVEKVPLPKITLANANPFRLLPFRIPGDENQFTPSFMPAIKL